MTHAPLVSTDEPGPWPWLEALTDVRVLRGSDLRQIIRAHFRLLTFDIPHEEALVIERVALVRLAEQEGVALDVPEEVDPVLLVAEPPPNERVGLPAWVVERRVLAAALHVRADAALAALVAAGDLDEAGAETLLRRLGPPAVRESARVLEKVERLEPDAGPVERLTELVATALELRHTTDGHVALWFPTLDLGRLDAVLEELGPSFALEALLGDVGAARARRLAARPRVRGRGEGGGDGEGDGGAEAPQGDEAPEPDAAPAEAVRELAARLARTTPEAAEDWAAALAPLTARRDARRGERARRRLWRQLDRAARALEQPGLKLRPLRWLRRRGPLFDRLEAAAPIRAHRGLEKAADYADQLGPAAEPLEGALRRAIAAQRGPLHVRYRGVVAATLDRAGLAPGNVPEAVAEESVVGELVDKLLDAGWLGFSDLRDAVSHNRLKLQDTTTRSLFTGDPLLRADRRLARAMPGAYRKSTVYMRVLQRASALAFGTPPGRWATRFAILPFLAAFVALEGVQHLVGPIASAAGLGHPELVHIPTVVGVGLVLLLLLEHRPSRQAVWRAVKAVGRGMRWLFVQLPQRVVDLDTLRALADNRAVALVRRFALRPALFVGLVWLLLRAYEVSERVPFEVWVGLFVAASLALNTPLGRRLTTDVSDTLGGWWGQLTRHVIPELFHLIARTSRRVLDAVEKLAYHVEEHLRLRAPQGWASKVVRAVAGRLWAAVVYVVRAYVTVLIEPQLNPVKHFPVVTVSHKLMIPAIPTIFGALETVFVPVFGSVLGGAVAGATVFLLPGLFGFMVWELSSNWRLFAANRSATLRPVRMGPHGEDLPGLLQPGFRSGAIPKHVEKLREKARRAWERGERPDLRGERRHLTEIEDRVHAFFGRELAELLARAAVVDRPAVQAVQLGRYRLGVLLASAAGDPLGLWLEDRAGTLVATLRRPGFTRHRDAATRAAVADAVAGVLAMARVARIELPGDDGQIEGLDLGEPEIRWADWVQRWESAGGDGAAGDAPRFPGAAALVAAFGTGE